MYKCIYHRLYAFISCIFTYSDVTYLCVCKYICVYLCLYVYLHNLRIQQKIYHVPQVIDLEEICAILKTLINNYL